MAEDESRVYKASEVHKRRAPKTTRPETTRSETELSAKDAANRSTGQAIPVETRFSAPALPGQAGVSEHASAEESEPERDHRISESETKPEEEPTDGSEEHEAPKRKRWGVRIAIAAACVVVAALLVSAGFLAGSRWLRFNDEHDVEGTWYVADTNVPVAFKDGFIVLDSNTSYAYELDTTAKTITYSLGNLEGQGRYWLNDDRNTLIITDGNDYTMWSTWLDDLSYEVSRLFGNEELPISDGSIVLSKSITLSGGDPAGLEGAGGTGADGQSGQDGELDGGQLDEGGEADGFDDLSISDVLMKEDEQYDAS